MTDLVTIGFKADTSGLTQAQTQLEKTATSGKKLDEASKVAQKGIAGMGVKAGQAGIQMQQFVGQIQGGQSAMLALSQQSADLGFVLGAPLLGAVVGISASVASFLIPSLIGAATDVEELKDRIEDLGEASEKTVNQIRFLAQENSKEADRLAEANEDIAESLMKAREELEKMQSAGTGLDTGEFAIPRSAEENARRYAERIAEVEQNITSLTAELDTNNQEIVELSKNTAELGKASDDVSNHSKNLNTALQAQIIALTSGAEAAELFAAGQAAIANGTESLLPQQIELIKQKYELKAAQEEAAKAAKEEARALAEAKKESEAADRAYQSILDRLDPMAAAQRKYNEELAILTEAGNTEAVALLKAEFEGLNAATEELKDSGISSLLDDVDSLTNGFSNLGNTIVDAFGDAAAQLNNFAGRMNEITKLREELTKKQQSGTLTLEENQKATEALNQLNQEMYATQLGAIGGVLGASKTMFKEQSKEREVLHRLEMGFMVAEMALAAEKAVVNAVAAITNQGSGDPYTAFARIATMSALMAGVLGAAGVAFSGGSGGGYDVGAVQDSQGTGTEFGDSSAKADSVIAIQERFEDIQIDQLGELRGIRDAMQGLTNGIEQLAMDIVGAGVIGGYSGDLSTKQAVSVDGGIGSLLLGGVVGLGLDKLLGGAIGDIFNSVLGGLFGKTKKKLVDEGVIFEAQEIGELISGGIIDATYFATIETTKKKLFGLSKKTSTKDETSALDAGFTEQIGLIFNYLADSVSESISLLGIETERSVEDFVISIGKVSFKDMTGEEIQSELEAVFSQQGDLIAKYMWPNVAEYQKLGEGALETLVRVAQEQAVFNDAINNLGLSIQALEPEQMIETSQALMELMGGLDGFGEAVSAYYDKFFSEEEKLEDLGESLVDVFSDLNIAMPDSISEFRSLVESLDLTTEAGRSLFAALMEIAPSFADFVEGMEDLEIEKAAAAEEERNNALSEAISELNKAVDAEKERIQSLIDGLNEEKAIREQALSEAEDMLRASFDVEIALIRAASNARIESLNNEISAINELKSIANIDYQERLQAVQDAESSLRDAFSAEADAIRDASDERIGALQSEKELAQQIAKQESAALKERASKLSDVANSMSSLADRLRSAVGIDDENTDVMGALAAARRGNFSLAQDLTVPSIESRDFSSASEMKFAQMLQRAQVGEIADLAEGRASVAERQLEAIERQTEAMSYQSNSMIDRIDSQISAEKRNAQSQIDALDAQLARLLGIDESVMSMDEAIAAYLSAQDALDEEGFNSLMEGYDEQIALIESQIEQEEANAESQIEALNQQLNTLLGIDTTVLGLAAAIAQHQDAKMHLDELNYDERMKEHLEEMDALDEVVDKAQAQIDKLNGIDNSVMSVEDAVNNLGSLLQDLKPPADDDIVTGGPAPVDTWATMSQPAQQNATISKEVVEVLESIARSTATSASNSTRSRTEGLFVRSI